MVHSRCQTGADTETLEHVDDVVSTLLGPGTLRESLETVLAAEAGEFDLPYGFLTRVDTDDGVQHVQAAVGTHDHLQAGRSAPLSSSYCRKTLASTDGVMCVNDALAEGWRRDPAYQRFELGSYVGATVDADDGVYGTLCFASSEPRAEPLTDAEVALVDTISACVGHELSRWGDGPDGPGTPGEDVEDRLLAPEMSRILTALQAPECRLILLYLSEDMPVNEERLVAAAADMTRLQAELRHKHLPKLTQLGYVDWDRETGEISRGPRFERIAPIFGLLAHPSLRSVDQHS